MIDKKVCPICGKEFVQKVGNQIYCSIKCKKKANNRNARLRYAKRVSEDVYKLKCRHCGEIFNSTVPTRKYCSPHCHNQAVLNRKSKPKETSAEREARQNRLIDEAEQCGLSYGQYMAQTRFFGKTFEELHAARLKELETAQ